MDIVKQFENNQDGNYHFKTIHYQKAGIYYYRVSEVRDNLEVTYDTTQYIVKVDVKANDSISLIFQLIL